MITMGLRAPLTTSRRRIAHILVAVGLGVMGAASCGVDKSGLGQMPFLPHDASSGDSAGVAGVTGTTGVAGGSGRGGAAGVAGSTATGVAGTTGVAGDGAAGNPAGSGGVSGTTGTAGTGDAGTTGTTGTAGTDGTAGVTGTAGTGVAGSGVAGTGGGGLVGVAGTGAAGTGGRGGGVDGGVDGSVDGGDGGMVTPCNATTCADGCCSGNSCVKARTAKLCGANGAACMPCGGCQMCNSMGQCRVDSASRWTIVAVSAQLPTFMSGGTWDRTFGEIGGSQPDPFCEFENPAGTVNMANAGVTDTITDSLNPTWNQTITPAGMTVAASTLMANSPAWQIWVGDDDGCNMLGCLADVACRFRETITEPQLRSGQLVINNQQSCNSLTLNFVCASPVAPGP
jgi:hypothetical protein